MVNRELDSTPPIPAVDREFWQRSPPTLPSQTPSAPPAGFPVFGPLPATVLGFVSPEFRGGGIGLGSQTAEPSTFTCPLLLFPPKRHCSCILVSDESLCKQWMVIRLRVTVGRPTLSNSGSG
jgi:hypothetical protein